MEDAKTFSHYIILYKVGMFSAHFGKLCTLSIFNSLCNKNNLTNENPLKPALCYLHLYFAGLKNGRTIQTQAKRLQSYSFHICNTIYS